MAHREDKVAVLLYGFLRTAEMTHESILKHVIIPNNADVFFFGPDFTDMPKLIHKGILDRSGFVKVNPKNGTETEEREVSGVIKKLYGKYLVSSHLHSLKNDFFSKKSAFIPKDRWLFKLDPTRFFSMFYNMQGAYELMVSHERENNFKYDKVIVTRPDLSFYSTIKTTTVNNKTIHIPSGEGFCPHSGYKNEGLSQVMFYVDRRHGRWIPLGAQFNDQLFVMPRSSADGFKNLSDICEQYIRDGVPLTPETILYYHFKVNMGLNVVYRHDWVYEIVRVDDPEVKTIYDLMILDLIDKYHPLVRLRVKEKPIKYFFKYGRVFLKNIIHRYIR